MNWFELIQPELLVLVPFMYIMAYYLTLSKINNRLIPFIMFIFSIVMVLLKYLFLDNQSFGGGITVVAVMQGAFLSMIVITSDQVLKAAFPKILAILEPKSLTAPKAKLAPTAAEQVPAVDEIPTTVLDTTIQQGAITDSATPIKKAPVTERTTPVKKAPVAESAPLANNAAREKYNNLLKKSQIKEEPPIQDEIQIEEEVE